MHESYTDNWVISLFPVRVREVLDGSVNVTVLRYVLLLRASRLS